LYDSFWRTTTYTQVKPSSGSNGQLTMGLTADAAANARLEQRVAFDLFFALIFCIVLHGFSAFKVFSLLYINYKLATSLPKEHVPLVTWTFNVAILFANELCHGYPFSGVVALFLPNTTNAAGESARITNWGTWIDSYGGLIPRWEVLFNITVLRLISFNLDYYWSLNQRASSPLEVCHLYLEVVHLHWLIDKRRSSSILPTSRNATAFPSPRNRTIFHSATTSHTRSTRRYILLAQS